MVNYSQYSVTPQNAVQDYGENISTTAKAPEARGLLVLNH